ncbi:hypothetical protein ACHHYP_06504 [Achlya hypogyna]|uniref:Uncharacterized protein n=1 Tax=Achlya hypogyna TaxID=1202772 RepID=A0A1V9YTC5_ACHHY|nr:hypothetical protein ACHHYP_06504 [Achlya hypogyna]
MELPGHAVWLVQVLEVSTSVVLFSKRWCWNEDARSESLRALVHSFSQFAREIDGGHITAAHFGTTSTSHSMAKPTRRTSTSLRQSLLRSSTFGSSPHSSSGSFHSVASPISESPQSPFATSPGNLGATPNQKLQMLSRENSMFQVVLFHAWQTTDNGELATLAAALLDKFSAMYGESGVWDKAKSLLRTLTDKDDNGSVAALFDGFEDVVLELVETESAQL